MHRLTGDASVWRPLYASAYGQLARPPALFLDFGKDWRWAYRARVPASRRQRKTKARSVGKSTWADKGLTYYGEFKRLRRHGYGYSICNDGTTYDGEWVDGLRHGRGAWTGRGGVWYIGEWVDQARHGHGTWVGRGGVCYVGGWQEDRMHGRGAIHYSDAHIYAGI
jgi:hypothetical protein